VTADTDAQLVPRVLAGDEFAAGELFRRHWPGTWRTALAVTASTALAEEAAQDAWIRAIAALARFDATRPFAPWLRRIVVNCALDAARRDRANHRSPVSLAIAAPDDVSDDELVDAVLRLPLERRAVVALRFWADLSVPEIAEALELPDGTARSRLARALADLRAMLEVRH
jgi:RNA polymerase sigma-70 factor, ECF subfamily